MGVPGSCYGGMAMHPERPVMAAVCMGEVKPPYVDILDLRQGSLKRRLQLQCSSAELVSCVTCLPGSDRFATGALIPSLLPDLVCPAHKAVISQQMRTPRPKHVGPDPICLR